MKAISGVGDFLSGMGDLAVVFGLVGVFFAGMGKQEIGGDPIEWTASADEPLCFPMGPRVPVAGSVNHRATYGPTNRYQSIVSTLGASGPIQGFLKTTIDDEVVTFAAGGVSTNGKNQGDLWLQTRVGHQPETALTSPAGLDGGAVIPDWGSAHKMSGRPADMITMKENSKGTGYQGGVVKRLHVVAGLYGWDPRQDSTWPGGSGSCRLLDPTTWVGIHDGAIAALNWAIGRWEGDSGGGAYGVPWACSLVGGIGASLPSIIVESFVEAANVSDANDWALIACPDTKEDKFSVFTNLLAAAGALPCRVAGRIGCITRAAPQPTIITVTADLLAGPVELQPMPSRLERKNAAICRYMSEDHRFELTAIAEIGNSTWLTEDRGRKRYLRPDFQYVPYSDQAASLGYLDLADAREPIKGSAPFKPAMRQIQPGDCILWDLPGSVIDGVKVRVVRRRTNPMTGIVRLEFRQETDAKYDDAGLVVGVTEPPVAPETPPTRYGAARIPVRRTTWDETAPVPYPTSATETTISILEHKAWFDGAPPENFSADTLTGLTASTIYGVFGRDGDNYEVEVSPALTHLTSDAWVFIGWQATSDGGGTYPSTPTPPGGWGGSDSLQDAPA